jgi:mRNA-degrading endonuclease toxin of MazEF toxin-antitoxin module
MPSTTTFKRGQVIVVNVPFSDRSGVKPRPALVISAEGFHRDLPDLIVCPISSQPRFHRRPGPGDCPLREWRSIGLRHPSTVRISKILAVDKQIVKKPLGLLSAQDLARVETGLRQALGLM